MQIYSSPHFNLNSMHTIRVQNANYTNAPIRRNKQELCTKGLGPGCFPPKITVLGGAFVTDHPLVVTSHAALSFAYKLLLKAL